MQEPEPIDPKILDIVLKAVIELQGKVPSKDCLHRYCKVDPNYRNVTTHLKKKKGLDLPVETVIDHLRECEKRGWIEGRGGFYQQGRGGAKRWHFLMLPEEEP